jgi:transposase
MFVAARIEGSGAVDKESLKVLLGQGLSVERIAERFGKHPSTVSYWLAKHGLAANNRGKHAAKGGIERERLAELVAAGMTIAEIAAEVGLSKATVRHWVRQHGMRTEASVRAKAARDSRDSGQLMVQRECPRHGQTEFALEGRGYYRCKRCRAEGIAEHRRRLKVLLVSESGGRCRICGYDRCTAALEFHHLDPAEKSHGISARGLTLSVEAARREVAKCILLCSNCHVEVENGMTELPVECRPWADSRPTALHQNAG